MRPLRPAVGVLLAVIAACGETEYRSVADAVRALESSGRRGRIQAARHLADQHPEDPDGMVVRALARAVEDDEPWVRRWATAALGNEDLDATVAVPGLIRALADGVPAIRTAAAHALGRHGRHAAPAVDPLVRLVDEEDGLLGDVAAWALAEIGPPARAAATPVLDRMSARFRARLFLSLPTVVGAEVQRFEHREELVAVRVDSRPFIGVRRMHYTLPRLASALERRADSARRDAAPYASKIHVYLALDEDLPWVAAQAVLGLLVHPYVRIENVEIAVLRAEEGDLGTLRVRVPLEPMYGSEPVLEPDPSPAVVLTLPGSSRAGLEVRLRSLRERDPDALVSVRADPAVPTRRVIEVLAAIRRAGLEVRLDGLHTLPETTGFGAEGVVLRKIVESARREVGPGFAWTESPR